MHRSFALSFLDGGLEEKGLNFLRASLHTMKVCTLPWIYIYKHGRVHKHTQINNFPSVCRSSLSLAMCQRFC